MFNIRDKGKDQYAYLIELKKDEMSDLSNTVYKDLLRTDQTSHNNNISDFAEKNNREKRKTHENILMGFLVELIGFEPVASTMST